MNNPAGQLFRLAAYGLHRSQTPMGDYLRRMKSRMGPAAATTATAHKIAIIFYTVLKNQVEYAKRYDQSATPNAIKESRPS